MKRTILMLVIEEDSFPTQAESRDTTVDTTAQELPSHTRIPTGMLPPPLQRLAEWVRR